MINCWIDLICQVVESVSILCFYRRWLTTTVPKFLYFLYQPLPPEEENALKQTVQEIIGSGSKVILEQKV